MEITIVDSVKGGCGKTTIALKYAIEKAKEPGNTVCVVDLDFLGSSLKTFITGDNIVGAENSLSLTLKETTARDPEQGLGSKLTIKNGIYLEMYKPSVKHLTDMFYEGSNLILHKYRNTFFLVGTTEDTSFDTNVNIDVYISSPSQREKNRFKPNNQTNYIQQIDYDYFKQIMKSFIKKLKDDMGYSHVIFDMPPNSDAYTDAVFDILMRYNEFDNKKDEKDKKYKVNFFLVSSLDHAHYKANIEWLRETVTCCDYKNVLLGNENLILVFNATKDYNNLRELSGEKKLEDLLQDRIIEIGNKIGETIDIEKISVKQYNYDKMAALSTIKNQGVAFDNINPEAVYKIKKVASVNSLIRYQLQGIK